MTTRTFTRAQIDSIVEQLKAITVDGEPVFAVHQEDTYRRRGSSDENAQHRQ